MKVVYPVCCGIAVHKSFLVSTIITTTDGIQPHYQLERFSTYNGDIRVTIANPKWVSAVKGNKDDNKDFKWIGDLFRLGLVPGGYTPPKPIRILREFTRYRSKLVAMKSGEQTDEAFDPGHCVSLLRRSLKKKSDAVLQSIDGFSIAPEQKARIRLVRSEHPLVFFAGNFPPRQRLTLR